jgi:hypothetical protein
MLEMEKRAHRKTIQSRASECNTPVSQKVRTTMDLLLLLQMHYGRTDGRTDENVLASTQCFLPSSGTNDAYLTYCVLCVAMTHSEPH